MRTLLVEDDTTITRFLVKGLKEAGHVVDHAGDGETGLGLMLTNPYDVVVLDLMLPQKDGLTVLREARAQGMSSPVLVLSAKHSVEERVRGLESGADDYMVKPFALSELLVRLQILARRRSATESAPSTLKSCGIVLDLLKREVTRDGQRIDLQPREFALLEYLMRHPGRILSKTLILENVYQYDFDPQTNVVDVLVSRLRSKVDKDFTQKVIHTIRGVGYVLKLE